jgi:hypothetical protein
MKLPKFEVSNPGRKLLCLQFMGRVWNFATWVQNFTLGHKFSHLGTKFHTGAQIFAPEYQISYRGTNFRTWVQNFIPGHKISHLGTKLYTPLTYGTFEAIFLHLALALFPTRVTNPLDPNPTDPVLSPVLLTTKLTNTTTDSDADTHM